MIFLIEHEGDVYRWTLCRKENNECGEALCNSVRNYPSEKECRAAVATAKKAMSGVRFAQTRVKDA